MIHFEFIHKNILFVQNVKKGILYTCIFWGLYGIFTKSFRFPFDIRADMLLGQHCNLNQFQLRLRVRVNFQTRKLPFSPGRHICTLQVIDILLLCCEKMNALKENLWSTSICSEYCVCLSPLTNSETHPLSSTLVTGRQRGQTRPVFSMSTGKSPVNLTFLMMSQVFCSVLSFQKHLVIA